jgi:hypothetical protein
MRQDLVSFLLYLAHVAAAFTVLVRDEIPLPQVAEQELQEVHSDTQSASRTVGGTVGDEVGATLTTGSRMKMPGLSPFWQALVSEKAWWKAKLVASKNL